MDSFFYSCELLRNPGLKNKPVIIASKGLRSVVTTASYEARAYGISSGMSTDRAIRLCRKLVLVAPDKDYYAEQSKRVFKIVKQYADTVEQKSVDECYIDFSSIGFEKALLQVEKLVKAIWKETCLSCSVGVGPNKLVAKLCSEVNKPSGMLVCSIQEAVERFSDEMVGIIPGIGEKTAERLNSLEVYTLRDLQQITLQSLQAEFGKKLGEFLFTACRMTNASVVEPRGEAKTKSLERTLAEDENDIQSLVDQLHEMTIQLHDSFYNQPKQPKSIGIKVKTFDFKTFSRDASLEHERWEEITRKIFLDWVTEYLQAGNSLSLRLLGVKVGRFYSLKEEQQQALDHPQGRLWYD